MYVARWAKANAHNGSIDVSETTPNDWLTTECADQIRVLKESVTFAMSLGAKELFHTNFLAFIFESRAESLHDVRTKLRSALQFPLELDGKTSVCATWREKRDLDLIVMPLKARTPDAENKNEYEVIDSTALVVEAKLKSIPTEEQLRRYTDDLSKSHCLDLPAELGVKVGDQVRLRPGAKCVLLAPRKDYPLGKQSDHWTQVNWQAVADCLPNDRGEKANDMDWLLADYKDSLTALLGLLRSAETLEAKRELEWQAFLANLVHEGFRTLRIHDLVSKYGFWCREQRLVKGMGIERQFRDWTFDSHVMFT